MKGTTLIKALTVLLIVFMLVSIMQPMAFAADPNSLVNGINANTTNINTDGVQNMASRVLGIIQVATAVIAVILIAVFGFKFVLGSAQEKADYQKSFIPLIVGVVVVFAASSIAKLIFSIASM